MTTLRSPKSTYVAAFLLGGLIALLFAAPARSAEVFRLDDIEIQEGGVRAIMGDRLGGLIA
jgi:hypothetical protein